VKHYISFSFVHTQWVFVIAVTAQYLFQSCSHGGRGMVENICYGRRRAETASLEARGSPPLDHLPWSACIASLGARASPPLERVDLLPSTGNAWISSLKRVDGLPRCACARASPSLKRVDHLP
jgi:hypothetical protein